MLIADQIHENVSEKFSVCSLQMSIHTYIDLYIHPLMQICSISPYSHVWIGAHKQTRELTSSNYSERCQLVRSCQCRVGQIQLKNMYVCMYVCMYVFMCVCRFGQIQLKNMYVCLYVCVYVGLAKYNWKNVCMCMYTWKYACRVGQIQLEIRIWARPLSELSIYVH